VYVVIGVQGSGTNFLSRILRNVFGFSVLRDRSTVFKIAAGLGTTPSIAAREEAVRSFKSAIHPTVLDRILGRKAIKRSQPFEGILAYLEPSAIRGAADFARMVFAYRAFSLGMKELAIKSDDLWEDIEHIDSVIPKRRVILLTRDFRDNIVSIAGKNFGPVEPVCGAQYVKRQFGIYEAEYQRSGDSGYHVRFETLVESPRRFVDEFGARFGLVPVADPDIAIAKIPKRANRIARWKALSPRDLAWCEGILREELQTYNYLPASPLPVLPSATALALARLRDTIRRVPQKVGGLARRVTA
jgi:hypothetical protein